MSLPWVKVHTTLLDNDIFKELSAAAKHTFTTSLILAGKLDCGGRLEIPNIGPVNATRLASYTSLKVPRQEAAIRELERVGFFTTDFTGTITVARFEEKAGEESHRISNAERQRRHRERKAAERNGGRNVTPSNETVTDKDKDIESNSASLRSAALRNVTLPRDAEGLRELALLFIARFANTPDPVKARRQLGDYSAVLAKLAERGLSTQQVWEACERCWGAGGEQPLFGPKIKRVFDFLGGPKTPRGTSYMERHRRGGEAS